MKHTLDVGEPHPMANSARNYIANIPEEKLAIWREAFASNAIEGNRVGEICGETLGRLMNGHSVSDRYVLGLAWAMRHGDEDAK